jgi:hypothetical protein
MDSLNQQHHWRSKFEDQLQVNYKEWLLKKTLDEFTKATKVEDLIAAPQQGSILADQLRAIQNIKEPIQKAIAINIAQKSRVREVESLSVRTVHFIFDPKCKVKVSPFTRKYLRILDGTLAGFEAEERTKFEAYIEAIENETLEGGNDEYNVAKLNPIIFEDAPFYQLELTNLSKIAFSVADDPFFKSMKARFYPEVIVMNMKGAIKGRCNPENKKYLKHGKDALYFEEDFREAKLKINDDRRVQINLNTLHPKDKSLSGKTVNKQGSVS